MKYTPATLDATLPWCCYQEAQGLSAREAVTTYLTSKGGDLRDPAVEEYVHGLLSDEAGASDIDVRIRSVKLISPGKKPSILLRSPAHPRLATALQTTTRASRTVLKQCTYPELYAVHHRR